MKKLDKDLVKKFINTCVELEDYASVDTDTYLSMLKFVKEYSEANKFLNMYNINVGRVLISYNGKTVLDPRLAIG